MDLSRWNRDVRRAKIKLESDGLRALLARARPFVIAAGVNQLIETVTGREHFSEPSDIERTDGTTPIYLGDATEVTITPPENLRWDPFPSGWCDTHHFQSAFVCALPDVRIVGSDAIKLGGSGRVIVEDPLNGMGRERFQTSIYRLIRDEGALSWVPLVAELGTDSLSITPNRTIDEAFPMLGFPLSFHHWVVEYLPRLRQLEQYRAETGRSPPLLLPENPPHYVRDSLSLLGYDSSDWITWSGGSGLVRSFVYPSLARNGTAISHPAGARWLRERMIEAVSGTDTTEMPDRIYISRSDAKMRRLSNRDAVLSRLSNYGVEPVTLADFTIAEQVALFAQADLVIGPHGAGLTNIVYGTELDVIELFASGDFRQHYHALAAIIGHNYYCCLGQREGIDIRIEPEQLEAVLNQEVDV